MRLLITLARGVFTSRPLSLMDYPAGLENVISDLSNPVPQHETQAYPKPARIVIASRESRLAMWQAEHVRDRLSALYPGTQVDILGMTTRGDQILDRPLAKVGGKGLFVKELEAALLEGRADLAVHSMKDVPMTLADEFALVATLERETPQDAFVSSRYANLDELPPGAVVGTSSLRREAQLAISIPGCASSTKASTTRSSWRPPG